MMRKLAIAALAAVLVGVACYAAAPFAATAFARSKVDAALKRLRIDNTAVVNRGEVSIDLWRWTVEVRDIEIIPPDRGYGIRIGTLRLMRPSDSGKLLKVDEIVAENIRVTTPSETTDVPRVEILDYTGPERGLSATPGIGARARTTGDNLRQISFERASIPLILTTTTRSGVRRTLRAVAVERAVKGVIDRTAVGSVTVEAPFLSPEEAPAAASASLTSGRISYEGFSLPALWRFYVGDDKGDRENLAKSVDVDGLAAGVTLRPAGRFDLTLGRVRLENVKTRSLGYALTLIDPAAAKARLGEDLTPSEMRQQLSLIADAGRAVAFEKVAIEKAHGVLELADGPSRTFSAELAELGAYKDWTLDSAKLRGLSITRSDGARLVVDAAEAVHFDARELAAYAEKVGRDEAMLTVAPTVEEFVRLTPRVRRVEASGFDAANREGSLKAGTLRVVVDAPLDNVPQKVAFRIERLAAAPPAGSQFAELLNTVELGSLDGSASFRLVFDVSTRTLTLDRFDYRFAELGTLRGEGEVTEVDPTIALTSGGAFVDKLLKLRLGQFKFTFKDAGAVDVLMRRAAERARKPAEVFREEFAREAQETIFRVFGPPAEESARAAAEFLRNPRSLEVTVAPRTPDQTVVEFIDSFDLGPAGLAQTIDLTLLYKR